MAAGPVLHDVEAVRRVWPDLRDCALVGIDLRGAGLDWHTAHLDHALLLGCALPAGVTDTLIGRGASVSSGFDQLPFDVARADLYSFEELTGDAAPRPETTLDARIGSWFTASSTGMHDAVVRALHDATIDAAVARFVAGRRIVGVMGGHALTRDELRYREIALLGRELARAGYVVATGGGPGAMEAANLGAWLSRFADGALDDALGVLARAPGYSVEPVEYLRCALEVRRRWPDGGESLGVPTWVYVDEPTTAFATHIAKYFTNSIRENGLLAIARSGVVYAAGGAGTEQEIFTDTAQNSLTLYRVRSPMVFFGTAHFSRERPELLTAVHRQATTFGWDTLVSVLDDPAEVVAFIRAHDPDGTAAEGIERRRMHEVS
jgi:predicted Rossmann-fold nucleotide-binding protein